MKQRLDRLTNLQQRVIAAVIGIPFIIFMIWYADWTFALLFTGLSALTQREFYRLLGLDGFEPLTAYGTLVGCFVCILAYFIEKGILSTGSYFLICPATSMIFLIKLYKKRDMKPFTNIGFTFLGIIYVAMPLSLIHI